MKVGGESQGADGRCFWSDKRVLVTGATGIIGSWLARGLQEAGAYVVALVRDADPQSELYRSGTISQISLVSGSLEDYWAIDRAVNEHEVDSVFHLGAQTIVGTAYRSPLPTFEANIRGTWHVLETCRQHRERVQRVVVASSDKAYGEQEELPYREEMPLLGRHPYDVSKTCADLIAQTYYHTYGLPVAIARCGNVYGGGDLNWSRIVPGTIRSLLCNRRPVIRSDGTYVRDYIYVEDVVQAYLWLGEAVGKPPVSGEAFNFSTESPMSVAEMYQAICKGVGCGEVEPLILGEAVAEIRDQHLCAGKARAILGWRPRFTLAEGLAHTVRWYRDFLGRAEQPGTGAIS